MANSATEEAFALQIRALGLPAPVRERRFCERMWRFDFAWPDCKLAAEIEGGIWTNGRHSRGKGMEADMRKYNRASVLGWRVMRFSAGMVKDGTAVAAIESIFKEKKEKTA